ncbi:MAG TPA: aldo/keto reductase [Burkholderiales bacterium]|nr:aldo/keto reductase [Burkholderiales bacterium]
MIELGLGLLSIGRPWGQRREPPPPEDEAVALLETAVSLGIRFFDTAPAYGASEATLGRFLSRLGSARAPLFIATKMGEFWDPATGVSTVNHSYSSLKASIHTSLERLGRIDLLQVHKSTVENLASADVLRAIEYARGCGVHCFGASVSDLAAAQAAGETGWCSYLQFPFSAANSALGGIFALARAKSIKVVINRPFAMGAIAAGAEPFEFIRKQDFSGVVLTGTKSVAHLRQNDAAFRLTFRR